MILQKYLDSMLPSFTKARLLEDLACTREELKVNTLPPLKTFSEEFGRRKFKNPWVQAFEDNFEKGISFKHSGNFVVAVHDTLDGALKNIDFIEHLINKYYADDVLRDAMTLIRVNILQYLETIAFAAKYSRRLLLAAITSEVHTVDSSAQEASPMLSAPNQGEIEWLEKGAPALFQCLNILSMKKEKLEEEFKEIPDMTVNPSSVTDIVASVGASRVDPMNFGLIPIVLNPIYHVRMMIADWQVNRFKAADEERKLLEFKLLKMKMTDGGKRDANVDRQIEYTEGRLQKLNYKLMEMEKSYGAS